MATTNLLDTKTVTFNEILGNGKIYKVPLFQRDYSWEQDNWEDLWNDLMYAYQHTDGHYMGSIVLQIASEDGKNFWIIDGQQRFTTLSVLMLAGIALIKELAAQGIDTAENTERADLLTRQYIGHKDPSSLTYSSKLFLNENNDGFYQRRLLTFSPPVRGSKPTHSEKLLWSAYEFFRKRISGLFESENQGAAISSFLNKTVGELLKFIQITVKDELNAYTVFETLNSRGVDLTSTDLLKNYLFSLVAKSASDLNVVKTQWKKIVDTVGLKEFPVFLRYYLNSRMALVTKHQLFKSVKQLVKHDRQVLELLDHLEQYANVYTALGDSDDELWLGERDVHEYIAALDMFGVTVHYPLLMVAYEKLPEQEFGKLLKAVVTISFRYNVIGKQQTNLMEELYNKAAVAVNNATAQTATDIVELLKPLYLNDETFRSYFLLKTFNTNNSSQKKIVRYILYKLEGGNKYNFETDEGTIEHILPESHNEHWASIVSEEEHEQLVYRLGNLTLLEAAKNREASTKTMAEKVQIYASSQYALSKAITAPEWNARMIKHRQEGLAKTASGVWKL